jgi:hypothetical protein
MKLRQIIENKPIQSKAIRGVIDECTSVGIKVGDKIVLAKNRDRTYNPIIKIVREIINGTEVLYMHDINTDYSEGINEHGIAIVNTTLQGKADEKEIKTTTKHKKLNADGHIVRNALQYKDLDKLVDSLELFKRGLGGHTTIAHPGGFIAIEKLRRGKPAIRKYGKEEVVVRTNHGINYPDQGYQAGEDRDSSVSRAYYAGLEARKAKSPEEVLKRLRDHHGIAGYLEPYRTNYKVWTSSQIMMNISDLTVEFVVDENTRFLGIEDNLPINYKPKIKLQLYDLSTHFKAMPINDVEPLTHM